MGLVADECGQKSTFSNDKLRLEITGPNEDHLTVIDVPGIFKRHTTGLTTKADIEMVEGMVHSYMKNPRCVMLTVVPANVDIATQEILEKAEDVDPEGIRTLGVLTKPDLVDKGAEQNVVDLVDGKTHQLKLGWHVLRNAGQAALGKSIAERKALGRSFFEQNRPWNNIDKEKVGIDAFRVRLQEILADNTRREFPKVKSSVALPSSNFILTVQVKIEINKKLKTCQNNLQQLGVKRQTSAEQTQYLMEIAMSFQKLSEEALLSNYARTDAFDQNPTLRLATAAVNRSNQMSEAMATKGHTFQFESSDHHNGSAGTSHDSEEADAPVIGLAALEIEDCEAGGRIDIRKVPNHPELDDILSPPQKILAPKSGSPHAWLKEIYRSSRGFEIGTLNSSLLAVTMKHQSAKWKDLALGYVADVVTLVHSFVVDALNVVCPVARVRTGLMSLLMDELMEKYKGAVSHVEFLLEVELDGTPATLNHYFNETLDKW